MARFEHEHDLLLVGNMGPEHRYVVGDHNTIIEHVEVLGGTLTHVLVVAGSLGQEARAFGTVMNGPGIWARLEHQLTERGVDVSGIHLMPVGMQFEMYYDEANTLLNMSVKNTELQGVGVSFYKSFLEKVVAEGQTKDYLTYICPLPPEYQQSCVEAAQQVGSKVALATHLNILESVHNREAFLSLIPQVDFLAVNEAEALVLSQAKKVDTAGRLLSEKMPEGVVFVTRAELGVTAYMNGEPVVQITPQFNQEILDVTGAGDTFFSSVVIRLMQMEWDGQDLDTLEDAMVYAQAVTNYKLTRVGLDALFTEEEVRTINNQNYYQDNLSYPDDSEAYYNDSIA